MLRSKNSFILATLFLGLFSSPVWFLGTQCHAQVVSNQTVIFKENFSQVHALHAWDGSGGEIVRGYHGTRSLLIANQDASLSIYRAVTIPTAKVAGMLVTIRALVKAEALSAPPKGSNRVKVLLSYKTSLGSDNKSAEITDSTFDWQPVELSEFVPKDAVEAKLTLGLEQVKGKAWFDEIEIRVSKPEAGVRRNQVLYKGHNLTRLRGVMYGPDCNENDLRTLAQVWGANQIRWQVARRRQQKVADFTEDTEMYDHWLNAELNETDKAVAVCEKYGLQLLLDLHSIPGQTRDEGWRHLLTEKRCQDKFIEIWERIAKRYKGRIAVYGYDLLNEPGLPPKGTTTTWRDLASRAIRAIRRIDPEKAIIYEPENILSFYTLRPLDFDRIIYSLHVYDPSAYTKQGTDQQPLGVTYPGVIARESWNKEHLRDVIKPAREFQRKHNVQIYVGEFSAIRWAPNNRAYLSDLIDLFEEYRWDWSYHAYRESDVWSVEHGSDPNDHARASTPTDRQILLQYWFAKNEKDRTLLNNTPLLPEQNQSQNVAPITPFATQETSNLSATQLVARFVQDMKRLNPDFNGLVETVISRNSVLELSFCSIGVTNISPIQSLQDLKILHCQGTPQSGGNKSSSGDLVDLSPLQGLKLEMLNLSCNPIKDLNPLKEMKTLRRLKCEKTALADLSPLTGLQLSEIRVRQTRVSDLMPLKNMPLTDFDCSYSPGVTDISPLAGTSLHFLGISGTKVRDLSVIKGMPLRTLHLHATRAEEFSALGGLPLENLWYDFVPERDGDLLRSIKTLQKINGVPVKEFWQRVKAGDIPKAM